MRLEDVESGVFGMLLQYLYTHELDRSLYMINNPPKLCSKGVHDPMGFDLVPLAKVLTLTERCWMPVLQEKVIGGLFHMTRLEVVVLKDRLEEFVGFPLERRMRGECDERACG